MQQPMKMSSETPKKNHALWIISFIFGGYSALNRFRQDEVTRMGFNRTLPENQRQGPTLSRKIHIAAGIGMILIQAMVVYAMAVGAGTRGGRSPLELLSTVITYHRLPVIEEVVNLYVLYTLIATVLLGNLQLYLAYSYPRSRYMRFFRALQNAGITDTETSIHKIWYYPDRLALLPLIGTVGEDVLKRQAMWSEGLFKPGVEFKELPGNVFLYVAKKEKPSDSTMLYDRYEEWTEMVTDGLKKMHWQLGEYVEKGSYKWKEMTNNSTMAFIGTTGSGKTEAMRISIAAAKIMNPDMRFLIHDPKAASDWDTFAPFTEVGRIQKTDGDGAMGFFYAKAILESRRAYCQEKGYPNIGTWAQKEQTVVPQLICIVDEFPNFNKLINFDFNYKKPTTVAGILYEVMTMGRSYGVWFVLGSQFGLGEHVPTEINKNLKVHVCLRVGSHGESSMWIDSDDAFKIGKGVFHSDGTENPQSGYAYIDHQKEYVRFWYADDCMLYHEFLKFNSPVIEGAQLMRADKLGLPGLLGPKIKALKQLGQTPDKLQFRDKKSYGEYLVAQTRIEREIIALEAKNKEKPSVPLVPLTVAWEEGEDGPAFADRAFKAALERLGIPHKYKPLYTSSTPTSRPSSQAPSLSPSSQAPSLSPSSQAPSLSPSSRLPSENLSPAAPKEASVPGLVKPVSVRTEAELKRPSIEDIFKSLAAEIDDKSKPGNKPQ